MAAPDFELESLRASICLLGHVLDKWAYEQLLLLDGSKIST